MEFTSFGVWKQVAQERGFTIEKDPGGPGESMFYCESFGAFDANGAQVGQFVVDVGQSWYQSFGDLFDSHQEWAAWMTAQAEAEPEWY